jgi:hypothetical protein
LTLLILWNIEIDPDENPFPLYLQLIDPSNRHDSLLKVCSSMEIKEDHEFAFFQNPSLLMSCALRLFPLLRNEKHIYPFSSVYVNPFSRGAELLSSQTTSGLLY